MPKLDQLKAALGKRVLHTNPGLLLYFMAGNQPYTVIAQANERPGAAADDDILIVSGNKPGITPFRSTDVQLTLIHINSL